MKVCMAGVSHEGLTGCGGHAHQDWELVVCLKGRCIRTVGDREIEMTPGTIICQPPGVLHGLHDGEGFQDLWVHLEGFTPPCADAVPVFQDDEGRRFTMILRMIYETLFRHEFNSERVMESLSDALVQLLVGWSAGRIGNPTVGEIVHKMILNLSDPGFDLSECVRESGYSPDHLRRCFRKETGKTPTAYLIQLRINYACRLLDLPDHGGYTVKEIAFRSGFSDPYYFSTMFRKSMGCSPTEYLRRRG